MTANALLLGLALVALLGVVLEEQLHLNKAKVTLFCGTLAWLVLFLRTTGPERAAVEASFAENLAEIATLWLFLMAAMTFVAYLNKKGLLETIIHRLLPRRMGERRLLLLTGVFCFAFSSLADNITATLCSVALVLSLRLPPEKTWRFAVLVVFAVNSGGVALITGDVTTLMIFLAHKVAILDLFLLAGPALLGVLTLAALLSRGLEGTVEIAPAESAVRGVDATIAAIFLATIGGTILANALFEIPPVLCFLFGLSLMFLAARFFGEEPDQDPILDYVRLVEFDTLLFFLGVLLLVGMLREIGTLDAVAQLYAVVPATAANFAMGVLSALVDNVPLTAALLKADVAMDRGEWLLLAYAVGVGGSLLAIGSAAGIVAMAKVEGLSFGRYLRFLPALAAAYGVGFAATWLLASFIR
ncbi:MAG: sodium:proton antiporter NhaD [Porticoccaceae bacterium]|nr:MAG: sodium:proton antiporter NhaD [Porticoccaceae bacterium]